MIFLSYLSLVTPHLEYFATYGLPDARELLISWGEVSLEEKKAKEGSNRSFPVSNG